MAQSTADSPISEAVPVSDARANAKSRRQKLKGGKMLHLVLFIAGGGALGYAYYRFIGCASGTCPITSNPYISTIYGAVMGYLMSGGLK